MERKEAEKSRSVVEAEVARISIKTWAYLLIYVAALTTLLAVRYHFIPTAWACGLDIGASGGLLVALTLPYVFSFIMLLVMRYGGLRVDKTTFALFYLASIAIAMFTSEKGYQLPLSTFRIRTETAAIHGYALPWFWMPSADAIRGSFYHGSLNNLFVTYAGEWAPVIATHIYYYVVAIIFLSGWAIILRHLWVDIEVLPFPHAQGWVIADMALASSEKRTDRRTKVFIVCALLGIILMVPYMVYSIYTGFPDPYGWLTNPNYVPWVAGNLMLTQAFPAISSSIAAPLTMPTDPLKYAFFFLIPLDGLLSMFTGYMIFWILLPQMLSYFGYYSGIFVAGQWSKWVMINYGDPLHLRDICSGMFLGVFAIMFVVQWRYFAGTFKKAREKIAPGDVSYSLGYTLFIIGAIGLIALFAASGVELQDALLGLLVIFIQVTSQTRVRAYVASQDILRGETYLKPFWGPTMPPAPEFPAGKLFIGTHTNRWGTGCDTFGPYYSTISGTMDGFKVASMAGVAPSNAFKVIFVGALLSAIISIPVAAITWHAFGLMELPLSKEWDYFWDGDAGTYNSYLGVASIPSLGGILIAVLLTIMRVRFIWWPIEPFGFAMGISECIDHWFSPLFVASSMYVVKYALIKVGGRKAYDEVGIPAAFGIITGEILGIFIVSIINIIRFATFQA